MHSTVDDKFTCQDGSRYTEEVVMHITSSLRDAFFMVHGLGLLRCGADGRLDFTGDGLVWTDGACTDGGVQGLYVAEEAL